MRFLAERVIYPRAAGKPVASTGLFKSTGGRTPAAPGNPTEEDRDAAKDRDRQQFSAAEDHLAHDAARDKREQPGNADATEIETGDRLAVTNDVVISRRRIRLPAREKYIDRNQMDRAEAMEHVEL